MKFTGKFWNDSLNFTSSLNRKTVNESLEEYGLKKWIVTSSWGLFQNLHSGSRREVTFFWKKYVTFIPIIKIWSNGRTCLRLSLGFFVHVLFIGHKKLHDPCFRLVYLFNMQRKVGRHFDKKNANHIRGQWKIIFKFNLWIMMIFMSTLKYIYHDIDWMVRKWILDEEDLDE